MVVELSKALVKFARKSARHAVRRLGRHLLGCATKNEFVIPNYRVTACLCPKTADVPGKHEAKKTE